MRFSSLLRFLVGLAIALNVSWIKLTTEFLGNRPVTWREVVPAVLGVIFFLFIIQKKFIFKQIFSLD